MRVAYADPPYFGCCKLYDHYHPDGLCWDHASTHKALIDRLKDYDGWVLHGHAIEPMLERVLSSLRAHDLKLLDFFVLFSGSGPGSGRWITQERARRAHSYLVVGARSRYWQRREKVQRERVFAGTLPFDFAVPCSESMP